MTTTERLDGEITEGRRGNKGLLMAGIGVGAAAVIGGGAYAAINFMGGGGDQPDSVLPASAAVYARVDLDPSVGEKIAAVRFFQGLDTEAQARLDKGEWREYVWENLTEDGGVPADLDYAEDIEPWLGDRVGLAVVPDGDNEPLMAVAVQVKDGQKALATLDKIKAANEGKEADEQFGYYLDGDYVVLAKADQVDAVKTAADKGRLQDLEVYQSDTKDLGSTGIASYWADLKQMAQIDPNAYADASLGGVEGIADTIGAEKALATGRSAGTLRLTPGAVEVFGISRGMEGITMPTSKDSAHLVNQLPAETVAAFSVENGAEWVQMLWDFYGKQNPEGLQSTVDDASEQGVTLPGDLKALLGTSMSLSAGPGLVEAFSSMSGTDTSMPALPIAYRVQTDPEQVNTFLESVGLPPTTLAQRTDNGVLTLGLHQPYVDGVAAPEGTLGDDAVYQASVADSEKADFVFFVNVNEFEKDYLPTISDEKTRAALEKLNALGWSSVIDNPTDGHFTLRLVADSE